jgi:hypothetical protein
MASKTPAPGVIKVKYAHSLASAFFLLIAVTSNCDGQGPAETDAPSDRQIGAFFKAIEDCSDAAQRWDQVRGEALAQGIKDEIGAETWRRLLRAAAKSGLKSRIAIQIHPICRQRPFFDEMVHELGYDSDFFTRVRVLAFMVERYPDEPRTAKFGLLLLLEGWNASWPKHINLRGNQPRDAIMLTIMKQWDSLSFNEITPEKCAQLLAQSEKWSFDKGEKKWRVPK